MRVSKVSRFLAGTALCAGFGLGATSASAALVTINFQSNVTLAGMEQAFGSSTLGAAIDGVYGSGTGTGANASLTGSVTYDTSTSPYQQLTSGTQNIANYLSPITAISLGLWGSTFDGDISGVAGLPAAVQTEVSGSTGCVGFTSCSGTPTANVGYVGDDVPTQLITPSGSTTFPDRDNFVVFFGGTADATDTQLNSAFSPYIVNTSEGEIFIWLFGLAAVSNPDEDLWDSAALPADASFFDPDHLEVMNVQFIIAGLANGSDTPVGAIGAGTVSSYSILSSSDPTDPMPPTNPVPEPGSALLVSVGLAAIGARRLGRRQGS
ncbi:MAG: PEP-CTERM sorting domain-containing protein [Caldilineaceae bacterium]|nr:PEP-CTERM sorting domain-containing protein [Nitrospira sp.]MCB0109378.1 PEP-CTERM sorting domain-containing protein [Caldilineaceae bacterium]